MVDLSLKNNLGAGGVCYRNDPVKTVRLLSLTRDRRHACRNAPAWSVRQSISLKNNALQTDIPSSLTTMRAIRRIVLSGQREEHFALLGRSSLLATPSHLNRSAKCAGYPAVCGRHLSSSLFRMAQSGTTFRGKQGHPLYITAQHHLTLLS